MAEYSIGFADKLIEAARFVAQQDTSTVDAKRTILHLSQLSCELILKSMLEQAGMPIRQIRNRSHDLGGLLVDLGKCTVEENIPLGSVQRVSASRLRAIVLDRQYSNATIGSVLTAENQGGSRYPSQTRYGRTLKNFSPALWLKAAIAISAWAREHWDKIRL